MRSLNAETSGPFHSQCNKIRKATHNRNQYGIGYDLANVGGGRFTNPWSNKIWRDADQTVFTIIFVAPLWGNKVLDRILKRLKYKRLITNANK